VLLAALVVVATGVGCSVLSGRTYQMDTLDMAPTVPRGTVVALQSETTVHRGDVIAVDVPASLRLHGVSYLLRRVIGLPGETISARRGHVLINARVLAEPYLPRGTISPDFQAVRIPAAHYFVLGDNRGGALDSRRFGPVPRRDIIGLAAF
jgi:signal peptidase I